MVTMAISGGMYVEIKDNENWDFHDVVTMARSLDL